MVSITGRSVIFVASLQAAVCLAALVAAPSATPAAAAIGALAVGRYAAVASFAKTLGTVGARILRLFAASAWILGLAALVAALAAVALRDRPSLPWAVAAALAEPIGMTALALGAGVRGLAARGPRVVAGGEKP